MAHRKEETLIVINQTVSVSLFLYISDYLKSQNPLFLTFLEAFVYLLFTAKNKCNMLTIRAEIRKDGKRTDGTYNVKLRFTLNRRVKRISTSLFASPKDLTKDLNIKSNTLIKKEADNLVRVYQERCAKLQIEKLSSLHAERLS